MDEYIIEMCNITKEFPGIIANDDVTLQLKKGEIHALLGGKRRGKIHADERAVRHVPAGKRRDPEKRRRWCRSRTRTMPTALGIGMVHQHFKLVHNFTVLENIILGVETTQPAAF